MELWNYGTLVISTKWDSAESLVKLKSNANEITRCVHTHVWFLSYHAQKFSRRCLYVFVLYLLPSLAVVKDSLTTELSVNSSSLNMLFTWRLTFCFVVRNNSAICCCVSQTVSSSTLTSSLMVSSGWYITISPFTDSMLFIILNVKFQNSRDKDKGFFWNHQIFVELFLWDYSQRSIQAVSARIPASANCLTNKPN